MCLRMCPSHSSCCHETSLLLVRLWCLKDKTSPRSTYDRNSAAAGRRRKTLRRKMGRQTCTSRKRCADFPTSAQWCGCTPPQPNASASAPHRAVGNLARPFGSQDRASKVSSNEPQLEQGRCQSLSLQLLGPTVDNVAHHKAPRQDDQLRMPTSCVATPCADRPDNSAGRYSEKKIATTMLLPDHANAVGRGPEGESIGNRGSGHGRLT